MLCSLEEQNGKGQLWFESLPRLDPGLGLVSSCEGIITPIPGGWDWGYEDKPVRENQFTVFSSPQPCRGLVLRVVQTSGLRNGSDSSFFFF